MCKFAVCQRMLCLLICSRFIETHKNRPYILLIRRTRYIGRIREGRFSGKKCFSQGVSPGSRTRRWLERGWGGEGDSTIRSATRQLSGETSRKLVLVSPVWPRWNSDTRRIDIKLLKYPEEDQPGTLTLASPRRSSSSTDRRKIFISK